MLPVASVARNRGGEGQQGRDRGEDYERLADAHPALHRPHQNRPDQRADAAEGHPDAERPASPLGCCLGGQPGQAGRPRDAGGDTLPAASCQQHPEAVRTGVSQRRDRHQRRRYPGCRARLPNAEEPGATDVEGPDVPELVSASETCTAITSRTAANSHRHDTHECALRGRPSPRRTPVPAQVTTPLWCPRLPTISAEMRASIQAEG